MLQNWVSKGEFYICSFILHNFIEQVSYISTLHVDIIVLNINELVMFARCVWAPRDQIDVHLNMYIYKPHSYDVELTGISLHSQLYNSNIGHCC